MAKKIIAIDLGGTSVKMAIVTQEGEIQHKWSIRTNIIEEGRHIIPEIIASIQEQLRLLQLESTDFLGVGIGTPGMVDVEQGTVIGAYNLNWTKKQAIAQQINDGLQLPCYVDNDANVAALGEQWQGAGDNESDVVMVTLGTGVGGGVVINHQLVHGASGAAGEIGHITIDPHIDIACTCGKIGCLEAVASATGIVNLARKYSMEYAGDSSLKERIDNGEDVDAKDIFEASKSNDPYANHIVDRFAKYLGLACSHIANTLNPQRIVLGGGVSSAGEYLREKVEHYYQQYTFPQIRNVTTINLATLGNDAGILGAAQIVNLKEKEG